MERKYIKEYEIPFPEGIIDNLLRRKCEEAMENEKIIIFLDEQNIEFFPKYVPITLNHLKEKQYKPRSFSFSFSDISVYYNEKRGCAYAITNATNTFKWHIDPIHLIILDEDKFYLTAGYRAYDLKEQTLLEAPINKFKNYSYIYDEATVMLLITQEYKKFAIIQCYVEEEIWWEFFYL